MSLGRPPERLGHLQFVPGGLKRDNRIFGPATEPSPAVFRSPVGPRQPGPHGGLCGVLISILCILGQSLYRSASGRVSFEWAFRRGGIHPTPRYTSRGRACWGCLTSLGGLIERLGRLRSMPTPSELDFGLFRAGIEPSPAVFGRRWAPAGLGPTAGYAES